MKFKLFKNAIIFVSMLILSFFFLSAFANQDLVTKDDIIKAQNAWADGVVNIGKIYLANGDYHKAAEDFVDKFYNYRNGPVLFKPTKATEKQFRLTKEAALSYFIDDNKKFPEDKGFALHPWVKIKFKNAGFFFHGNYAVAMGTYLFTPKTGNPVTVEYTFGYLKNKDNDLKINLHHSSLPYK
jgi:hypothetical protein